MPSLDRIQLGKAGEELACAELRRRGYAILARRYRTRAGELDIVAADGLTLVFVEVKARASADFGSAAAAVTPVKRRKLCAMAVDYIARRRIGPDIPCRFDVVTVQIAREGASVIELYQNAFGVNY